MREEIYKSQPTQYGKYGDNGEYVLDTSVDTDDHSFLLEKCIWVNAVDNISSEEFPIKGIRVLMILDKLLFCQKEEKTFVVSHWAKVLRTGRTYVQDRIALLLKHDIINVVSMGRRNEKQYSVNINKLSKYLNKKALRVGEYFVFKEKKGTMLCYHLTKG